MDKIIVFILATQFDLYTLIGLYIAFNQTLIQCYISMALIAVKLSISLIGLDNI